MSLPTQPLSALLPQVVALSRQAGAAIMSIYQSGDTGETRKADDSPLTLADMASHRAIVAGLNALTPDIPVLSEEASNIHYDTRRHWQRYWLVDPLDGTKEFIKRNGEFTVNIALVEAGVPILGVVYAPVLDTCYYAAHGAGAHMQRGAEAPRPIQVRLHAGNEPMKVVASRSHSDARTAALLEKLGPHESVSMGSSLKFCLVAEGVAHFYPRLGPTMEWDTAAADAVVREAGGVVQDAAGVALRYNKEDLHNPEFFVMHVADSRLAGLASAAR
jgi:3'(2'), 5'-bisphosphate nucleotidase